MPRLNRLLRLSLIALLLAAWQGALLHPLKHRNASGGFIHFAGSGVPHGSGDKGGPNARCDTIAAVAACVGGAPPPSMGAIVQLDPLTELPSWQARFAPRLAYRSQGPPSLL
jgi:hypothetical protein